MAALLLEAKKNKTVLLFAGISIAIIAAILIAICIGQYPITLKDIFAILTGGEVKEITRRVFYTLRVPRVLASFIAGIGLGLAGSIYQTIFKNHLASPDIIGVAPGANLGSAFAIVFLGATAISIQLGAFIGGIVVVLLVLLLVKATPSNTTATYILAGIVLTHTTRALIMLLKYYADPSGELAAIEYWTMGSFANVTLDKLLSILPVFLISFVGIILLRNQIGLLSMNEDESRMLGVRLTYVRTIILVLSTLMVASVISISGLITFIGLVAPHIARLLMKRNNFTTCMMAALIGGLILIIGDVLARTIYTAEIPISILTTLIGVPVLVYFLLKQKGLN